MVLVFILLAIISFILIILFLILASTLKIEIKDLSLSNMEKNLNNMKENKQDLSLNNMEKDKKDKKDLSLNNIEKNKKEQRASYVIKISLNIFNNIKWLWISLDSKKVKKLVSKIPEIDIKKIESDFTLEDIKVLKKLYLNVSKFKLYAILGLENPIATAFLVAILSSSISIAIPRFIKKWNKANYEYKIKPIYNNQNLYKIRLNCIIELKIVHIINVIYILIKKGKSDKNERTASNRKPYAYSHE